MSCKWSGTSTPRIVPFTNVTSTQGEGLQRARRLINVSCPRLFVLLSGLAHVTLPDGSDEAWIVEGVNGLVVAADVVGHGHHTAYPSDKETVALQIPFAAGKVPDHKVLKQGACHSASQVISRELTEMPTSNEL
jgi:hypothetical protein